MPAMIIAVACIIAVVGVRNPARSMVASTKRDTSRVGQAKKEAVGRLKLAQSQTHVADQKHARLMQTRTSLTRKVAALRQELRDIGKVRRRGTASRRVP